MRNEGCLILDEIPQCVDYENLNEQQSKAVNIIISHYYTCQDASPLRIIIHGTIGTSKSYLIGVVSQALQNASFPKCSPLLLLALTGVAAFNIGASMIHSKLKIPIKEFTELQGTRLAHFQEELSNVKCILIDEMSFLGERLIQNIDSHLRQAFPENNHKTFGGMFRISIS